MQQKVSLVVQQKLRHSIRHSRSFNEVVQVVEPLPVEEKAQLIERVLHLSGQVIVQSKPLDTMSRNELGDVLLALAHRLRHECSS